MFFSYESRYLNYLPIGPIRFSSIETPTQLLGDFENLPTFLTLVSSVTYFWFPIRVGIFLGYCQIIWDVWSSLVPLDNPGWIVGEKLLGVTNNYAAAATNYKYKNTQLQKYTV